MHHPTRRTLLKSCAAAVPLLSSAAAPRSRNRIGVATMHNGIENTTELVRASDVALYAAKDAGRNKVMLADVEDGAC